MTSEEIDKTQKRLPEATLGIDVEDWFHVENLAELCPRDTWDQCESRLEGNIDRLLEILEDSNTKATFFILGIIAERFPETVVEKIANEGHELGSHGYDHRLLFELSAEELREDTHRSKMIIEDASGTEVLGYRAPCFSIHDQALRVLEQVGYKYDSSLNPVYGSSRYGKLDLGQFEPCGRILRSGKIYEIPMSKFSLLGKPFPISGGGYFRLYPYSLQRYCARKIIQQAGHYNFYLHPWEIDPGIPRLRKLRPDLYFRHYLNLGRTEARFRSLLKDFSFGPLRDVLPKSDMFS